MEEEDNTDCNISGQEMGYQFLDTRFSGTNASGLSGHPLFPFLCTDKGTAGTLEEKEL